MRRSDAKNSDMYNQVKYVDSKTGAEYLVKEPKVSVPEVDYTASTKTAELRYRSIMGLPDAFQERSNYVPVEERQDHEQEPMVTQADLDSYARQRQQEYTRGYVGSLKSNEIAPWALEEETNDKDDYYKDENGHLIDRPAGNTIGPFFADKARHTFQSMSKPDLSANANGSRPLVPESNAVAKGPVQDKTSLDDFLLKEPKLQEILNSAYRNVFGVNISNNNFTKSTSDVQYRQDTSSSKHSYASSELLKPWSPNVDLLKNLVGNDALQKPEILVTRVGKGILNSLMNQRLIQEMPEISKSKFEQLSNAIGRAVLNTVNPLKGLGQRPNLDSKIFKEVENMLTGAVGMKVAKGLLFDIKQIEDRISFDVPGHDTRAHGPSNIQSEKSSTIQDRMTVDNDRPTFYSSRTSAVTLGNFAGKIKPKQYFVFEDTNVNELYKSEEQKTEREDFTKKMSNVSSYVPLDTNIIHKKKYNNETLENSSRVVQDTSMMHFR